MNNHPIEASSLSLIIPAYHASDFIGSTISRLRNSFGKECEIIVVVNDPDQTLAEKIEVISKKDKKVRLLNFDVRLGKGKAIIEGFKVATGNILGFIDADAPFALETIKSYIPNLIAGQCDCIIFSKWKGRRFSDIKINIVRKCLSRLFNFCAIILLRLNYHDTQGGCKLLRKEVMGEIGYDFLCLGFAFDAELLLKIQKHDLKIKEVAINCFPTEKSTVNIIRDALPVLLDLIKLRRKFKT
jgi:dolichyl-phosphate beta-glucosyltransferase